MHRQIQDTSPTTLGQPSAAGRLHKLLSGLAVTGVLALAACDNGGSGLGGPIGGGPEPEPIAMATGEAYAVGPNARVVSTSPEPAVIDIEHDLATDKRLVTLVEGSADLLQGDFELN